MVERLRIYWSGEEGIFVFSLPLLVFFTVGVRIIIFEYRLHRSDWASLRRNPFIGGAAIELWFYNSRSTIIFYCPTTNKIILLPLSVFFTNKGGKKIHDCLIRKTWFSRISTVQECDATMIISEQMLGP